MVNYNSFVRMKMLQDVLWFVIFVKHGYNIGINKYKQKKLLPKPCVSQTLTLRQILKVLSVTLNITEGKAQLNPARSRANVTIVLNDEAHGVVEFIADSFTVHENDHNITARIPIVRRRGTHGILKVYYR